ncbi:hypothetical protein KSP35_15495 [Aquihabitans sp. G128]|uniref:hypothetical protein n=1 Tax=Aquihabitans sp. G128 TaxID=2849779 RepID=UPI001C24E9CD|nr:hypothetical protein [Aquihabitans sp. G128]QXC59776.1 hypothetical protein KSP35_15495 [Aquihabitans sp. G128]
MERGEVPAQVAQPGEQALGVAGERREDEAPGVEGAGDQLLDHTERGGLAAGLGQLVPAGEAGDGRCGAGVGGPCEVAADLDLGVGPRAEAAQHLQHVGAAHHHRGVRLLAAERASRRVAQAIGG